MVDEQSGVHSIEWQIGMQEGRDDVMPRTRVEGDWGSVVRQWWDGTAGHNSSKVQEGMIIHSTLIVTNSARDSTIVAASPVRVVLLIARPHLYACQLQEVSCHPCCPW